MKIYVIHNYMVYINQREETSLFLTFISAYFFPIVLINMFECGCYFVVECYGSVWMRSVG